MNSSSMLPDWILPAFPALMVLLATWMLQASLDKKNVKPWMIAHYGRVVGILIFIPFLLILSLGNELPAKQYVLVLWPVNSRDVITILLGLVALTFLLAKRSGKAPPHGLEQYHKANMGKAMLVSYTLVWITYLVFYEIYFRGYLLLIAFPDKPTIWIVLYNVMLYALIHANKNWQQVLWCFPFGFLLCYVTFYTGHIWFAVIIHIGLALGIEVPLLTNHRYKKALVKLRSFYQGEQDIPEAS